MLQKSKVAAPRIFRENNKRETIADSYILNRAAEVTGEFDARGSVPHVFTPKTRLQPAEFLITCAKRHHKFVELTADIKGMVAS
jgi:hypothetical protein